MRQIQSILLICGKHIIYDRLTSLRETVWNHKTSLTSPEFITLSIFYCSKRQYQVLPQQVRKENCHVHVNLVCVCNNVSIVRTFPTLWYFCFVWRFTILIIRPSREPSWSWSYTCSSWIYNYLCNQRLLPLKWWVRIASWRGVLDTTLCDSLSATCDRSVVFYGHSGFLHQ